MPQYATYEGKDRQDGMTLPTPPPHTPQRNPLLPPPLKKQGVVDGKGTGPVATYLTCVRFCIPSADSIHLSHHLLKLIFFTLLSFETVQNFFVLANGTVYNGLGSKHCLLPPPKTKTTPPKKSHPFRKISSGRTKIHNCHSTVSGFSLLVTLWL